MNFYMFKLVLEKAEGPEIKLPTSAGSWKKQEASGPITSWEKEGETVSDFIFGGSKITEDGD